MENRAGCGTRSLTGTSSTSTVVSSPFLSCKNTRVAARRITGGDERGFLTPPHRHAAGIGPSAIAYLILPGLSTQIIDKSFSYKSP